MNRFLYGNFLKGLSPSVTRHLLLGNTSVSPGDTLILTIVLPQDDLNAGHFPREFDSMFSRLQ